MTVPPAFASRSATFVTQHDLRRAREDALLQLRIGRTAHYYSLVLYLLLFSDGLLVTYGVLPAATSIGSSALTSLAFLIPVVAGTFLLALFGLLVKWEEYQLWPWERHFTVSLLGVVAAGGLLYLLVARVASFGPSAGTELLPWLYPLAIAGTSLALVGLALTWPEWTNRKLFALGTALAPPVLVASIYLPATGSHASALTLTLLASGGLFLFSGSLLHFISSGTEAHEQELINTGQSRLFQLSEETRRKTDAVQFREATVFRREAEVTVSEAAAKRKLQAVEQAEAQIKQLEADLEARGLRLREEVRSSVQKIAEGNQLERELRDKTAALSIREDETRRWEATHAEREAALSRAEGDLSKRQLELTSREKELSARTQATTATEARQESRRQELDQRTADVTRRETDAANRELEGTTAVVAGTETERVRDRELADREARLATLQSSLAEQNALLGRKSRELDARETETRRSLDAAATREQQLSSRETQLAQREGEVARKVRAASDKERQYSEAIQAVEQRARDGAEKEGELATRIEDARRTAAILQARESTVRQRTEELAVNRNELDTREKRLEERTHALDARENELRELQLENERAASAPARLTPSGPGFADPPASAPILPPVATATRSRPPVDPNRSPSGVGRLDELLAGGLPPKSHLLLIGPPFLGKELLLYNFLAEGLRRGEPALLLSTVRAPAEVSAELAVVLPEFKQYERIGQVHWIDASNPAATPSIQDGGSGVRAVVKGPLDYTGILSAVAAAVKRVEGDSSTKGLRLGALTLSACLAHGEERTADGFVRNLVGILKPRKALAMYAIDPATLDGARVEGALSRMDGAIRFREEHSKTQLQIQGLGEVATREWVEYRATNRSLTLGSFRLERIR
ncbi:MAG TPA: ATPase domain-containing protein [Thermoplasmata archaeon]|nr:ATPase domain-containing protein [Thermoplasmata archaeon]